MTLDAQNFFDTVADFRQRIQLRPRRRQQDRAAGGEVLDRIGRQRPPDGRGFADALMMRLQQAIAFNGSMGYLPPHHYDQVFTAHGVIMIFFVAMPLVVGFMNYVVPLQIGARDVAFPFLNNFSFWMTASGAGLVMASLFVGEFARTGWLPYPPLSETTYSPGVGVDYYLWAVQISGIGWQSGPQ